MRRLSCWTLVAVLFAGGAWGIGIPMKPKVPAPVSPVAASMKDLERNAALGAALTQREASPGELDLVQKLADRGVATAQKLVQTRPQSPEGHYLLGSWLLYGYRVVTTDRLELDEEGEERHTQVKVAVLGLRDNPSEGLEALGRARQLAPRTARYVVDYGAALVDCDQPAEAMSVLKSVWSEALELTAAERLQVAMLMSDAHVARGELSDARAWLYRAIAEQPQNAPLVTRLKDLDVRQAEAAAEAAEEGAEATEGESTAPDEEAAPEEEMAPAADGQAEEGAAPEQGAEEPEGEAGTSSSTVPAMPDAEVGD